jgi:hypothetical protein
MTKGEDMIKSAEVVDAEFGMRVCVVFRGDLSQDLWCPNEAAARYVADALMGKLAKEERPATEGGELPGETVSDFNRRVLAGVEAIVHQNEVLDECCKHWRKRAEAAEEKPADTRKDQGAK